MSKEKLAKIQSGSHPPESAWPKDWFAIEILKYFINGPAYQFDPLPNRLKNNKAFPGIDKMMEIGEKKLAMIESLIDKKPFPEILEEVIESLDGDL